MISTLQHYKNSLVWFGIGLVMAILLSWGLTPSTSMVESNNQSAYQADVLAESVTSDFAASHLEPNFYQ